MKAKGMLAALLVLALAAFAPAPARAVAAPLAFTLENFENYPDDATLRTVWQALDGTPEQSIGAVAHGGTQSLQLDYDLTADPFFETVALSFSGGLNLSSFTTLTIWFQGLPANGHDGLYAALQDNSGRILEAGSGFSGMWTDQPGWQRWDVDLSGATVPPTGVTQIILGVELLELTSSGTGTVYIDDISLSNGLETVWLGGSTAWADTANWDSGVPGPNTNARIPSAPAGGPNFPQISAAGAAVHDLFIEPGASVDLGQQALAINGTITNQGELLQNKSVGANASVPFLTLGAHPGLLIETESFLTIAPNAPALLTEGLGETAVAIRAGRPCDSSGATVLRCFDITPANSGAAATITFFFAHEDLNQQECAALSLYRWHDEQWSAAGSVEARQCDTAPYSVTVSGVTAFSPFALAEESPVAVGLQDFSAAGPEAGRWLTLAVVVALLMVLVVPVLRAARLRA